MGLLLQPDDAFSKEVDRFLTLEAKFAVVERAQLLVACETDTVRRAAAFKLCKEGTPEGKPGYIYFLENFAWIMEERNPEGFQKLPFHPYPYQLEELAIIHQHVQGSTGITGAKVIDLWLKSRDMGLTWIVLAYFLWDWLINKGIFLVGGKKQDDVDKINEGGTLFSKMRFLLYNLPTWFLPPDLDDKLLLLSYGGETNPVTISGDSTGPDFGRGKRKKAALIDEFQTWEHDYEALKSVSQTTNVMLLLGTPNGYGNLYASIARGKSDFKATVRRVHWTLHPLKTRDMEIVDGKATSEWYRQQCATFSAEVIASELDLSFESSQRGLVFAKLYGIGHQKERLKPWVGVPVRRCWDPGGIFAVVWIQVNRWRRVRVLKEHVDKDAKITDVAEVVKLISADMCKDAGTELIFTDCGDPSGSQDNNSAQPWPEYDYLRDTHQWDVEWQHIAAIKSNFRVPARITAIEQLLRKYIASGISAEDGPALEVDVVNAPYLHEAFIGGYRKVVDTAGNVLDKIDPNRRPYNDVMDAFGYGILTELGIPEQIKQELKKLKEEEIEDAEAGTDDAMERWLMRTKRC